MKVAQPHDSAVHKGHIIKQHFLIFFMFDIALTHFAQMYVCDSRGKSLGYIIGVSVIFSSASMKYADCKDAPSIIKEVQLENVANCC